MNEPRSDSEFFRERLGSGNTGNDGAEFLHRIMERNNTRQPSSSSRQPGRTSDRASTPVTWDSTDAKSFSRVTSPVQDFRFSTPTDYETSFPSGRNDAVKYSEEEDDKEVEETGGEEVVTGVEEGSYEQLIRRSQIASQSVEQLHFTSRGGEERGSEVVCPPGDFHLFHPSHTQDVTSVLPQRFHQGRESTSVLKNVTHRDSKRSKARSLDQDYQRRVSFTPNTLRQSIGAGFLDDTRKNLGGTNAESSSPRLPEYHGGSGGGSHRSHGYAMASPEPSTGFSGNLSGKVVSPVDHGYMIRLTFKGDSVQQPVSGEMTVIALIGIASAIYGVAARDVLLILFGMIPQNLIRGNRLSGPPLVGPGANVLVFDIPSCGSPQENSSPEYPTGLKSPFGSTRNPQVVSDPLMDQRISTPKFLGNFKLPKFDGTARHWKAWDKTFVRFLSIHQLDHVIAESFFDVLPLTPQAFSANKMMYYILEDAITAGSLAAKYLRLAAKWNGNEAYTIYKVTQWVCVFRPPNHGYLVGRIGKSPF